MKTIEHTSTVRQKFSKYFWDCNVLQVSDEAVILRVLEKGTTKEIQVLIKSYGLKMVKTVLMKAYTQTRPVFSPNLIALFSLWFDIPDDLSQRAMTTAKANDHFSPRVSS